MTERGDPGSAFWADRNDESDRRYRDLVNAIGDGLYRLDADGRIVGVNDALVDLTGHDREALHGAHVSTLLSDADRGRIERGLADGETTVDAGVLTADGRAEPCEIRVTPTADGEVGVVRERTDEGEPTPPASVANVIDEADIAVFVLDESFEVAWADRTVEDYFGLDRDAILGRPKREVVAETVKHRVEDPERFAERVLATYEDNDGVEQFECRVTAEDGRDGRWLEHYSKPIEAGQYAGGRIEIYYDITDRKRSEGSLRDAEERFESLVDAVEEYAIFRLDPEGTVVSWNEGAHEIKGYDAGEIVGEHFSAFYTEADREAGVPERNLDAALADGSVEDEGWRVRRDGSRFWAKATITALFDDDGTHRGFLKVTRDMTDRHRRERELETELERLLGRISDAFYAVDEAFRFTHVNERAEQLLGYSADELEGTVMWKVLPGHPDTDLYERFETALAEQEAVSFEHYFEPLDIWAEVNVYPSETGLSVYLLDVTERKDREAELRRTERRYRTLAERLPNGLVTMFDDDMTYELAAGQAFDRLPDDPDEIEGAHLSEVWDGDAVDVFRPEFEAALDGEERSIELSYAGREWVLHAVPITDDDGEVFAGMTVAQDITERKERERYLEDVNSRLEAAMEAGAVGTWEWRIPEDEMVVGESFAEKFGVDPEAAREGISLDWFVESIHPEDRERVQAEIQRAIEERGEYEAEYRTENADGEYRWVIARGHVECEDGEPVRFPGVLTDITERKRAELELQRNKEQLEALFEVLPVGVVVADTDGSVVSANDTVDEMCGVDITGTGGYGPNSPYSVRWLDSGEPVRPEEKPLRRVTDGEVIDDPDAVEIEAADGRTRAVEVKGRPIRNAGGEVSRGVVTLTDITERREYERRLEESNERLEQFAYSASHDLQEPLRMVSSYLQLIEDRYGDELDAEGREFLDFAVDGADRMKAMIDGLLAYSRVETRGNPLEPTDLNAVLDDVLTDLQFRIEESGAGVTVGDLPTVEGDEDQLRQVFQNLLGNAVEYSGDDPPEVDVSAEREGDRWRIDVADEGIGIDPEDQERVFELFQRLHTREAHDGTGIGLALCQRIVERHGGEVRVDSEPGAGTTFSVTLPAVEG